MEIELTDQGSAPGRAGHTKTTRGSSSRPTNSRCSCEGVRGLPDIQLMVACFAQCLDSVELPEEGGGDEETRTPDPLLAKEMLFQLSYVPLLI